MSNNLRNTRKKADTILRLIIGVRAITWRYI